ncbi:hypothetical protein SAMN06265222_11492 [Neorhodopirellula lusitana]|uniref:Uncharacterized protein n=1 Tax=Neorhodopirellula lusitana TaxID=445327 RepID=A0ABY1QI86_9BACT|nr:hypothetical protein SAMN06265222_11492 [Neorhodopirellula lusitana]
MLKDEAQVKTTTFSQNDGRQLTMDILIARKLGHRHRATSNNRSVTLSAYPAMAQMVPQGNRNEKSSRLVYAIPALRSRGFIQ